MFGHHRRTSSFGSVLVLAALGALGAACGGKVDFITGKNGGGGEGAASNTSSQSTTGASSSSGNLCSDFVFSDGHAVAAVATEGERVFYTVPVTREVIVADLEAGTSTVLWTLPETVLLGLDMPIALDADRVYVGSADGLFAIPKEGGAGELVGEGMLDEVVVDETGLYWKRYVPGSGESEVVRRRPDGTTIVLGTVSPPSPTVAGMVHASAGVLVPDVDALVALDIDGGGKKVFAPGHGMSFPFEFQGNVYFIRASAEDHGFFRASLDGSFIEKIYPGPLERAHTDGSRWAFVQEALILGATFPDGATFVAFDPMAYIEPRDTALTPNHLVTGWNLEGASFSGVHATCRSTLGL